MRFEVPQFIEIEDKIFGPFTWKQFVFLAGGAGTTLVLYFTLPFILFIIIALPLMALSGFLAFHKVNNRPFSMLLESMFTYFTKTKLYLWRRRENQVITGKREPAAAKEFELPKGGDNINTLARKLEINALNPEPPEPEDHHG